MLRILLIGIGGLIFVAVSFFVYAGLQPAALGPGPVAEKLVAVIATAHAVRAGSLLQPNDIGMREVPQDSIPPGAHLDSSETRNALVGAMVRRMLGKNDVIAGDDVLRPGDRGFLAAVLAPGSRAISVAVDAVSGEAGLIWPGDRVDLILTQTIDAADQSLAHRVSGELVLGDIRVIAVDQQLVQGGQASGMIPNRGMGSRTITLEVTPDNAARIAVATRLGKLLVVLRAAEPEAVAELAAPSLAPLPGTPLPGGGILAGAAVATPPPMRPIIAGGPVWGGDVSQALGNNSVPRGAEVRLFQGTKQVEAYKF